MLVQRFVLLLASVALALSGCARSTREPGVEASPTVPSSSAGARLFSEKCAVCHGTSGEGGRVGPALSGISKRKTSDTIRASIENPEPPMPKLYPAQLSKQDLNDLTAYVGTL